MTQISVVKGQDRQDERTCPASWHKNFVLALELLQGCGMIFRAKLLRTSPTDGRCHRSDCDSKSPLSFRVHPSSVIWCNSLNLSRGSRV